MDTGYKSNLLRTFTFLSQNQNFLPAFKDSTQARNPQLVPLLNIEALRLYRLCCDLIRRHFDIFQKLIVPLKFGSKSTVENKSEGGSLIDAGASNRQQAVVVLHKHLAVVKTKPGGAFPGSAQF